MTQPIVVNSSAMCGSLAAAPLDGHASCAKTPLQVKAVRRLYDDATLSVIRGLTGDWSLDQACAPIARQIIDETCWRSMRKQSLQFCRDMEPGQQRQLARAFAYDRYLPRVVLPIAQSMPEISSGVCWVEIFYFADAIGVMGRSFGLDVVWPGKIPAAAFNCFVTPDVQHLRDLEHRSAAFHCTLSHWLECLASAHVDCDQLSVPEVECLLRDAQQHGPFIVNGDRV